MSFTVHPVPGHGAEDVVVAPDGSVFTGTDDGAIVRLSADGRRIDRVAHTGGRPLGLELFENGDLLVCDALAGLLVVHLSDGSVETLLTEVEGVRMRFCNNAAIAADGTIWFSDSSLHFGVDRWKDDFVQDTRTGRLLRRDPDGTVTVVIEGLAFANGVALSKDEDFVAVAETGARTVVRRWLSGPREGERDFLVRDLPGYPDNIARGTDGLIWVTIASPKDPLVERLQAAPLPVRRAVTRIPEKLQPKPKQTIRVQAFDDTGLLVHDVDLSETGYHMVTGVREHEGRVWMGSLHEPAIAVYDLPMKIDLAPMGHLDSITSPQDLRSLDDAELDALAAEIRDLMISTVARTSGHLGPNLGVVELTLAIHRVFDSPRDRVVFDTGHQSYVHKLVTGRFERFGTLRQEGGISGYPSQAESDHDIVENSHASTSLSYADGLAKAYRVRGEDRHVVAVIGDGALTGGMAWEALNNIAIAGDSRLVIVVNDNERSYTPTIGGLATALTTLRTNPRYEQVLDLVKKRLNAVPGVGPATYDALHAVKKGMKDALAPQGLFEDLGLKYVGPVDGHDRDAMEQALTHAKRFNGPVIVHAITRKGAGYDPAERHEADQFHAPGPFDVQTGAEKPKGLIWTDHFSQLIVDVGARRKDVVAITAAMMHPVGLDKFAAAYPDRTFDVGIAEQHATTSAAGMAMGGLHPVFAVYATFLNRAFDQVLMDVALHKCGVTFVLDRSGVTGDDGASHNGMWDMSILQVVPGLRLAAPRDVARLAELLDEAVEVDDAPTVVRFPKGPPPADVEAIGTAGGADVLVRTGAQDVLIVAVGSMCTVAVDVARRLTDQGIGVTVVDPRWVKPVDPAIVELAREHDLVVSLEDNGRVGGCGAMLLQTLNDAGVTTPFRLHGIPQEFLDHAKRDVILARVGLDAQTIGRGIVEDVTAVADGRALLDVDHRG